MFQSFPDKAQTSFLSECPQSFKTLDPLIESKDPTTLQTFAHHTFVLYTTLYNLILIPLTPRQGALPAMKGPSLAEVTGAKLREALRLVRLKRSYDAETVAGDAKAKMAKGCGGCFGREGFAPKAHRRTYPGSSQDQLLVLVCVRFLGETIRPLIHDYMTASAVRDTLRFLLPGSL